MAKDYYQVLGLKRDASPDEIRKAFHRLAHKYHPDKGGNEAKFKEINEAYQVLSDQKKRSQYDQFGRVFSAEGGPASGTEGAPGWDFTASWGGGFGPTGEEADFNFSDLGDVFEEFFGFSQGKGRRRETRQGKDIEIALEIGLEETLTSREKQIRLEKLVTCERCQGSGAEPGSTVKECFSCRGNGQVQQIRRSFLGSFTAFVTCPECQGEGTKPEKPCNVCQGEGRRRGTENIFVLIPAGIDHNQVIKIALKGDQGRRGGRAGDLYVRILIRPHPVFERKGDDLYLALNLPFTKMVLGGEVEITDLSGKKIILTIPASSEPGKVLRLSDRGIPHFRGRGSGHLYVTLNLKVPKKVTPKQKELLEKLQSENL